MNTRLTKEDQAMIKEVKGNKISGPIYSEDGLRLLKVQIGRASCRERV